MLIIRLSRIGKKKQPYYRLIINEKTKDTRGDFLEQLGSYDPRTKKAVLKAERIKYWLSKGAQTSATVHNLLVKEAIISEPKVKVWKPKKKATEVIKETKVDEGTEGTKEIEETDTNKADGEMVKENEEKIEAQPAETAEKEDKKPEETESLK